LSGRVSLSRAIPIGHETGIPWHLMPKRPSVKPQKRASRTSRSRCHSSPVDTHVTIVRPLPSIGIRYFGQALMAWEPRFSTMGRGATNQTELSRTQIGDVEILVPPRGLVQQFEDVATQCMRQVWVLMEQNQKLRAARDLLLPRLMRGGLAV